MKGRCVLEIHWPSKKRKQQQREASASIVALFSVEFPLLKKMQMKSQLIDVMRNLSEFSYTFIFFHL